MRHLPVNNLRFSFCRHITILWLHCMFLYHHLYLYYHCWWQLSVNVCNWCQNGKKIQAVSDDIMSLTLTLCEQIHLM